MAEWFREHNILPGGMVGWSEKGWTNDAMAVKYIKDLLVPWMKKRNRERGDAESSMWLLILDGHGSHLGYKFIDYALNHNVLVFSLPPHSTHILQPLDVRLFSPLARYYRNAMHKFISAPGRSKYMNKYEFFR